jgi:hypothetical protein
MVMGEQKANLLNPKLEMRPLKILNFLLIFLTYFPSGTTILYM